MQEIDALGRTAAGEDSDAGREACARDDVVAQARDEPLCRLVAVLVSPGDDDLLVPRGRIDEASPDSALDVGNLRIEPEPSDQSRDRGLHLVTAHRSLPGVDEHLRR